MLLRDNHYLISWSNPLGIRLYLMNWYDPLVLLHLSDELVDELVRWSGVASSI